MYVPGESFGELALLYNAPRAATIIANTECDLWALDRKTFTYIIKSAVQKKREKYDNFLSEVEILSCMERDERDRISDALKEEWFSKGDYIIHEGETGDRFYLISEGTAIATKHLEPGKPATLVKNYQPGDYFGERALLMDQPRAANIIAESEQVCVVSLDRAAFKRLLGPLEKILARNEDEYKRYC